MIRDLAPGRPTSFFLPQLCRSLLFSHHPKTIQIEAASNGWIERMLACTFPDEASMHRYLRQRVGLYGVFTTPHAADDRVRNVTDWYQFLTTTDDTAAGPDSQIPDAIADRYLDIVDALADDATPHHAVSRAAHDLWRRTAPGLTTHQQDRLAPALKAYYDANLVELRLAHSGDIPDYETSVAIRTDSYGWSFMRLATEYAIAVDLTPYLDDPRFADVHHHAIRQIILVNDLLSFRKEYINNEPTVTSVLSLWHEQNLTFPDTVARLCDLVTHHEQRYHDTQQRLLATTPDPDGSIRNYLTELGHVIAGSHYFHHLTPRYWGEHSAWDGRTSGWVDFTTDTGRLLSQPPQEAP